MNGRRVLGWLGVSVAGLVLGAMALSEVTHGQQRTGRAGDEPMRRFGLIAAGGPAIGVSVRDVTEAEASAARLAAPSGALVDAVVDGGPADEAGLRAGDIVVVFDGDRVRSARHLSRLVEETPPGRRTPLTVVRDGARTDLAVAPRVESAGPRAQVRIFSPDDLPGRDELAFSLRGLDELPGVEALDRLRAELGTTGRPGRLGVSVQELTPELATYFGVKTGLLVSAVVDDSPAARAGIRAGDVISTVDGEEVTSVGRLRALVGRDPSATGVELGVVRDKQTLTISVTVEAMPTAEMPRRRWTL